MGKHTGNGHLEPSTHVSLPGHIVPFDGGAVKRAEDVGHGRRVGACNIVSFTWRHGWGSLIIWQIGNEYQSASSLSLSGTAPRSC